MAYYTTLVSAEVLAAHLDDPSWRIFDCRHDLARPDAGEQAYREAHIPNARFLHLDRELSGPRTGRNGRHPLPDPATLAHTLARHGVGDGTQVVAYDDSSGGFAARLWWLLRWLGHERVAVLDGGLAAWRAGGRPLSDRVPPLAPAPASFRIRPGVPALDAAQVRQRLGQPGFTLIDARGAERFRGDREPLDPVAGHIPGARNRPYTDNLTPEGRFKPPAQLREEYARILGAGEGGEVVAYCGSGVSACHNLLALELAGFRNARLYPGSWSEWCSDPSRPVATGTE